MNLRQLEPREKKILAAGAAVAVIVIGYLIIDLSSGPKTPGLSKNKALRLQNEFTADLEQYLVLEPAVQAIDTRLDQATTDFDLYAELSTIVQEMGLQIKKMNKSQGASTEFYHEEYVDVDIQSVTLNELVSILEKVDQAPAFLRVSQLSVKRRRTEEGKLDVNIRVSNYTRGQEEEP